MSKYLLVPFIVLVVILVSCNDDNVINDDEKTKVDSHLELFDLKGDVSEFSEAFFDELSSSESAYDERTMAFDKKGHLISYKAFGASFSYLYDSDKLMKVIADYDDGKGRVEFHFFYGEHDVYLPCPVNFGGLSMFLIKGLSNVTINENSDFSFSYAYDGKTLTWTEEYADIVTSETYMFKGIYPENRKRKVVIIDDGELVPLEDVETTYVYGADGDLLSVDESGDKYGEKTRNHFTYHNGRLQKEEVFHLLENEMIYVDEYAYNENGYFIKKVRKTLTSEQLMETASYIKMDEKGNWLVKTSGSKAPWGIALVTCFVKRDIKYFSNENN